MNSVHTLTFEIKRGQILWVDFDPTLGHEIQKRRPALVLSDANFSKLCPGQALIAPITSGGNFARIRGFTVDLTDETVTSGTVRTDQIRVVDLEARKATFIEDAPDEIVQSVLDAVQSLLQ